MRRSKRLAARPATRETKLKKLGIKQDGDNPRFKKKQDLLLAGVQGVGRRQR
jgi:hypothetical protein